MPWAVGGGGKGGVAVCGQGHLSAYTCLEAPPAPVCTATLRHATALPVLRDSSLGTTGRRRTGSISLLEKLFLFRSCAGGENALGFCPACILCKAGLQAGNGVSSTQNEHGAKGIIFKCQNPVFQVCLCREEIELIGFFILCFCFNIILYFTHIHTFT